MLVALLILGLAVAVGTTALARREMSATPLQVAEALQGAMLRARSEALRTGAETAVLIDVERGRFAYPPDASPVLLPEGMRIGLRAERTLGGRALVVFRPDGSASGAAIRFEQGGRAAILQVSWLTGLARLRAGPSP